MAIDLNDYRRTAAQRGWGSGWPSCSGAQGDLVTIEANEPNGKVTARVTVRKRLARLVNLLLDESERRGYDLHADQCGGYNCRPIGGTRTPSNHSWGVAVDLNWRLNPMRRPKTTNIPGWMVAMFKRHGFAWGGDYSGTPDTMHFEFMGTPSQADEMTALALRELVGGAYRKDNDIMENHTISGKGILKLNCPVGSVSAVTARAWLSASLVDGTGSLHVFAQDDDSGVNDWTWDLAVHDGRSDRRVAELRDGTTQLVVQHDLTGSGVVTLETAAK